MGAARYYYAMFVRKNRNRSGSVSVQIISKSGGRYQVIKTIGSSSNPEEIERFVMEANNYIHHPANQLPLFSTLSETDQSIKNFIESMSNLQVRTIGPELIFGTLFDRIGFNVVGDELFRHITIARLAYPTSKLKTVDYLYRYRGIKINIDTIYRFLDKLSSTYKELVQAIAFDYTKGRLKNISVEPFDLIFAPSLNKNTQTEEKTRAVNSAEPFTNIFSQSLNKDYLAGAQGFEPWNAGAKDPCLTAWLRPNNSFNSLSLHKKESCVTRHSLHLFGPRQTF